MQTFQFIAGVIAVALGAHAADLADPPRPSSAPPKTILEQEKEIIEKYEIEQAAGAELVKPLDPEAFVKEAVQSNLMKAKAGHLAIEKAQNPALRLFARRLVDDHSKTAQELKLLAEGKGITAASDLNPRRQEKIDDLAELSGEEFDQAFARLMHTAHQKEVRQFDRMARETADPQVQQFARHTLPVLRKHLLMVRHFIPEAEHALEEIAEPAGAEPDPNTAEEKQLERKRNQGGRHTPDR
jgi:putative membrane protein